MNSDALCLWTCNLWTFLGRQHEEEKEGETSGLFLILLSRLLFPHLCWTCYTHTPSWTRLVLLQVTPISSCLICVCISVGLISPGCVIPPPPSLILMVHTAQPTVCMYVFMHYEPCEMHIYWLCMSLYTHVVLDPLHFVIPLKVKGEEMTNKVSWREHCYQRFFWKWWKTLLL